MLLAARLPVMVGVAAANKKALDLLRVACLGATDGGSASSLSGDGGRFGGGLHPTVFVPVPPRLGGVVSGTVGRFWVLYRGASAVDLSRVAAGCRDASSVRGRWLLAGGSGVDPRPHRRVAPDPEVEYELGVVPRPTIHSDMWASLMLLLVVHKALVVMELLLRVFWLSSFFLTVSVGAGGERWLGLGGAGNPRVLSVIFLFFRGFSAICSDLRILRGCICMCAYSVPY